MQIYIRAATIYLTLVRHIVWIGYYVVTYTYTFTLLHLHLHLHLHTHNTHTHTHTHTHTPTELGNYESQDYENLISNRNLEFHSSYFI